MGLDVLELVVHENSDLRGGRDILAEERRVFFEGFVLYLADDSASLRYVLFELAARLWLSVVVGMV